MTEPIALPEPVVELSDVRELAADLVVIGDRRVPLVPNIGVIGGRDAVLVVDTGMGPANAETVLTFVTDYAAGRELFLTTTHFHPEHAFGAELSPARRPTSSTGPRPTTWTTKARATSRCSEDSANRSLAPWRAYVYLGPISCTTAFTIWIWAVESSGCERPAARTATAIRSSR